jgi:hypothetical protein
MPSELPNVSAIKRIHKPSRKLTIRLREYIANRLIDCSKVRSQHSRRLTEKPTAMNRIGLLVRYLNAEFLCCKPVRPRIPLRSAPQPVKPTSSIAITTSTVSKLSSPKSFEKCDVFESLHLLSALHTNPHIYLSSRAHLRCIRNLVPTI